MSCDSNMHDKETERCGVNQGCNSLQLCMVLPLKLIWCDLELYIVIVVTLVADKLQK